MNLLSKRAAPLAFETDRLRVRRYRLTDDHDLYEAARASIREVYPFLPWCHPGYSLAESRAWLKSIRPEWENGVSYAFAIRDKLSDQLIGGCGMNRIDQHPVMNLGYWTRSDYAARGVATEATVGLAEFGFTHLGLQRIEIIMSVENVASQRVAEKAGSQFEGVLANRLLLHGKRHDARLYSLTPETFLDAASGHETNGDPTRTTKPTGEQQ